MLGLPRDFSESEMVASWRALSALKHPDRNGGTAEAHAAFAAITEARRVLTDQALRRKYDAELDLFTEPCPKCKGKGAAIRQVGFSRTRNGPCLACNGCGRTSGGD